MAALQRFASVHGVVHNASNCRRRRRFLVGCTIVDIVSAFPKVSTKSDHARSGRAEDPMSAIKSFDPGCSGTMRDIRDADLRGVCRETRTQRTTRPAVREERLGCPGRSP